jgi:hypothetical protein
MNDYCVDLNLNLSLFNSTLPPIEFLKLRPVWADNIKINSVAAKHTKLDLLTEITQEVKDFFDRHNFFIEVVEVFYLFPNDTMSIHSDRAIPGDYAKINWIYGGKDSVMKWYKILGAPAAPTYTTPIDSPSLQYEAAEVELAHEQTVGHPSLVQVGCPHNVVNGLNERFCVSIVFKHKSNQKRVTMNEAINAFKEYIN